MRSRGVPIEESIRSKCVLKCRYRDRWSGEEAGSLILAGDRGTGPGSNLARDDRIARVVNEFR